MVKISYHLSNFSLQFRILSITRHPVAIILLPIILVVLAASLRLWPLGSLGVKIPYITFFPAAIFASLLGGFRAGLIAVAVSSAIIIYWAELGIGARMISLESDWPGVIVFWINGLIMSLAAEQTHQSLYYSQKAREAAEEATEAKTNFLANMSHEMRTPLNAFLGFNYLLSRTELNQQQREYVDQMDISSNSLLHLIDDILDISKIEARELAIEFKEFDLEVILDELASYAISRSTQLEVDVIYNIGNDVPRYMTGAPTRLKQALANILGNAIKFSARGQIALEVQVRLKTDSPNNSPLEFEATKGEEPGSVYEFRFVCTDEGPGIDEELLPYVFDAFFQADTSAKREYAGTGLGLAITKEIIELLGGSIAAENRPTGGAKFEILIPMFVKDGSPTIGAPLEELRDFNAVLFGHSPEASAAIEKNLSIYGIQSQLALSADEVIEALSTDAAASEVILASSLLPVDTLRKFSAIRKQHAPYGPRLVLFNTFGRFPSGMSKPDFDATLRYPFSPLQLAMSFGYEPEATTNTDLFDLQFEGSHVVLVEDDPSNQQVMIEMLRAMGIKTTLFTNGIEALEWFASAPKRPDLVLMDIQMPIMDGLEATTRLREHFPKTELIVVAVTANALARDLQRAYEAGVNGHLAKPVRPSELLAVCKRHLKTRIEADAAPHKDSASDDKPKASQELENVKVLIVEDNPQLARAFSIALKVAGANVVTAASVEEIENLIEKSDASSIDIVISDLNLGSGGDPVPLLQELSQSNEFPILWVSGSDLDTSETLGTHRLLLKPLQTSHLISAIREELELNNKSSASQSFKQVS